MIIDLSEFTNLIIKTKLTPNQLYICFLLHEKDVGNVLLYTSKIGFFDRKDIKHLIDNDYIYSTIGEGQYKFLDLYTGPKFTSLVTINEEEQGEEFWKEFPSWIIVEGRRWSAKAANKEDIIKNYFKAIKGSVSLHNQVMSKLRAWKEKNNGHATMNIKNFVGSRHWEALEDGEGGLPEHNEI